MKKKIFSVLLILALVLCFAVPVMAVEGTLLSSTGAIGTGNEARIEVTVPAGTTLGDIDSIAWSEYLMEGYPPHVDIIIEGDALVFEYAHNTDAHYADGPMPFGALTGTWYQTFSDDGEGPAAITDTSFAWLSSGAPGPYPDGDGFIGGTLAEWKAGIADIDASTSVLRLEIEVDNWVIDSEAYVDNIDVVIGGQSVGLGVTILLAPDIVAISVTPGSINFGDLLPGAVEVGDTITVTNTGTQPVNVVASVQPSGTVFDGLSLDPSGAFALATNGATQDVVPTLTVPDPFPAGPQAATLIFTATTAE